MLSEDLRNIARRLDVLLVQNRVTGATVRHVVERLDALAEDARALELHAVPPPAAIADGDLPERVVRIATALARRGVRAGLPDGGDAA